MSQQHASCKTLVATSRCGVILILGKMGSFLPANLACRAYRLARYCQAVNPRNESRVSAFDTSETIPARRQHAMNIKDLPEKLLLYLSCWLTCREGALLALTCRKLYYDVPWQVQVQVLKPSEMWLTLGASRRARPSSLRHSRSSTQLDIDCDARVQAAHRGVRSQYLPDRADTI